MIESRASELLATGCLDKNLGGCSGLLLSMIESLQHGLVPSEDTCRWFIGGMTAYIAGEDDDLAAALELPKSTRYALRKHLQRQHLRDAWNYVSCENPSPKARAERLADEVDRFERRIWPKSQQLAEVPSNWSRVRTSIYRARRFGSLPSHWRRLKDICDR